MHISAVFQFSFPSRSRVARLAGAALALALLTSGAALAQLQLPGAVGRTPSSPTPGSGDPGGRGPDGQAPSAVDRPAPVSAPSETGLIGVNLLHDGRRGLMRFARAFDGVRLERLVVEGDHISRPGETCRMEFGDGPYHVRFSGFAKGLRRYSVELEACPFTFVVLDGALIATHRDSAASSPTGAGTCQIQSQDCQGFLAGVWGPSGRAIGATQIQAIERARGVHERAARDNFRALLRAAGKNRALTSEIAADQAGFSARRSDICRDYLREPVHGFCASRVTQARAIELTSRLNERLRGQGQPSAERGRPAPARRD